MEKIIFDLGAQPKAEEGQKEAVKKMQDSAVNFVTLTMERLERVCDDVNNEDELRKMPTKDFKAWFIPKESTPGIAERELVTIIAVTGEYMDSLMHHIKLHLASHSSTFWYLLQHHTPFPALQPSCSPSAPLQ